MSQNLSSAHSIPILASIPQEVRDRMHAVAVASEIEQVGDALNLGTRRTAPATQKKITYAEPSNCVLHFLSPEQLVRPSFATMAGLSLCPDCIVRAAHVMVNERMSVAEMVEHACIGSWLDDGSEAEGRVA